MVDDSWAARSTCGAVYGVSCAANGSYIASGNEDGSLDIWGMPDPEKGPQGLDRYQSLDAGHGSVNSVAWSPDDPTLVTGHSDGTIIFWRPTGPTWEPRAFGRHVDEVTNVAWSPRSVRFVSASLDKSVRLWDRRYPRNNLTSHHAHRMGVNAVAWTSRSGLVASVDLAGAVLVWRPLAEPAEEPLLIQGHAECVSCVDFSFDGDLMATKATDGTVKLWSTTDWSVVHILNEDGESGWGSVAFHPGARVLATLGEDEREVRVWQIEADDVGHT